MEVKLIVCVFLCAFNEIEGSRSDIKRLQSKVDLFLGTIFDMNHNIQELREIINNLDNQNASCVCDMQQGYVSREAGEDNAGHPSVSQLLIEEFESKMAAVQRGFRQEKSAVRKLQKQQAKSINDIARNVNDSKTELHAEITQHLDETVKAVTNLRDALNEHRDTVSSKFTRLSDELDEVKTVAGEVNKVKSDVTQVSNKLQDMSSQVRLLYIFVLQGDSYYKVFGTSVYKYHTEKLTWTEAQQKCQEDGFHLAEINDDNEHEFVKKLVVNDDAWLGGTDAEKEGDWRWATSWLKVMSSLWNKDEPNNFGSSGGEENCLHSHGNRMYGLNDRSCETKLRFVCEAELPAHI